MTEEEKNLIKELATSEEVVQHLWLLWELYMSRNNTASIHASNMTKFTSHKDFMKDAAEIFDISKFDFIKDLAIENPGESSVLKLSFEQKVMDRQATDFLPFFGTDIGMLSLFDKALNQVIVEYIIQKRTCNNDFTLKFAVLLKN